MTYLDLVSQALTEQGVQHVFVDASAEATGAPVHFKSSSERAAERKAAKLYRMHHRAQLRRYARKYAIMRTHHKPNAQRSAMMKKVAQHYGH